MKLFSVIKKALRQAALVAAILVAFPGEAVVPTDGCTYPNIDGLSCTNLWCAAVDINKSYFEEINWFFR